MIKTGAQHIASLNDGREIYLDGQRVADATTHPAYRGAVASVGRMFDFQSAPENLELPQSYEALKRRRAALEAWTGLHAGFLGRAPDHVASCISGMYMGREVFEAYNADRAKALRDYYVYARDNDWSAP
ncbi:4-hydroxyphenylacetate 3-hydroxylase N-terminal domain-containing protein [Camelimonas abortus]|uniref:4-hydroxyphenylacetate 3-hydroxylase N-terminal domain-containing protein n=1 Tax=Camelimonas abortus TaxID=1017184 RepID=A0ABV7LDD6_9HYPH